MNKNKGFIGIGLIVAIILGIVVVGGGAYYLGTNKSEKVVENLSAENENQEEAADYNQIEENNSIDTEIKDSVKEITLDVSNELARTYKTAFTEALKQPANFNGHYVVTSWGCGSGCLSYGIVDKLTGKAYQGPGDDYGNISGYSGDEDFNKTRWSVDSNIFKAIGYNSIDIYKFENEKFTKIKSDPFPTKDVNLIKLTSCGVSLSKTSDWNVISSTVNEIKLDIAGDTHTSFAGIDIKCVLSNTITDTDAKFGNITYFYDMGKKAWMETDNKEGEGITPNSIPVLAVPLFIVDGLPVFRGTGRWLTYIVPTSPSTVLYFNEGDTEGGYTQTLTNLVNTIRKL